MYIGGLDIGTTGCKITVFDEKGNQLFTTYRDYPIQRDASAHEIDANAILNSVYELLSEAAKDYPVISGIGVTSFGETFVAIDEEGTPLRKSMLYTDPRGAKQVKEICEKIDPMKAAEISGINPHEMYSLPKLMWIRENEPETFKKIKYVLQIEDFIVYKLTGIRQIDYSLATRTMGFDIKNLCWSEEIFAAADISTDLFSTPVPSGTVAGPITEEVSKKTGLTQETVIVSISQDQIAAAVGAGVFSSNVAVDGAGTVQCMTPVYDEIPDMKAMVNGNFAVVPYVVPGKYVCYAFSYTGGALMQWCTGTLAKQEKVLAKEKGISVNQYLEEQYVEKRGDVPTGLLVLPHFAGAATPYMDTGSKGTVLGLTTDTAVADIYKACMEGVVYEMVTNYEYLKPSGVHFTKLHATGGGAHSKVWMQMKADMLNKEIVSLETVDAGTVGSAMLTGIAVGVFKDLDEAAGIMVKPMATYKPDLEKHNEYMKIYERYSKVYDAVRPLM